MAGTTTVTHREPAPSVGVITAVLVADDADASFASAVLPAIDGRITAISTIPGGTAPTNLFDVTVANDHGLDVLGGAGANITNAAAARAAVTNGYAARSESLTLAVAGNAVNSAGLTVQLHYTTAI